MYTPQKKEWTIISKEGCPFCKKAKTLLEDHSQPLKVIQITPANRNTIYKQIDPMTTSYRYFPVIFNKDAEFIGGYTELKKILYVHEEDEDDRSDKCVIS